MTRIAVVIDNHNLLGDAMAMAKKYGFDDPVDAFSETMIDQRMELIMEEYAELCKAREDHNAEEFVDALVDLMVVTAGTMIQLGIDPVKAWDEVHRANMSKIRGPNPSRPDRGDNDLYKPEGWVGPCHEDNHGRLVFIWG